MSAKRQATTDLNHENWDQEDPSEHEEMGSFKTASQDVLEKRVIRTAKRRQPAGDEAKKSVFSGFGGFNKAKPSSFDFLSNLTNGNKTSNGTANKNDSAETTSFLGSKTGSSNSSGGIFNMPTDSATKPTFGTPSSHGSGLFGRNATSAPSTGPFFNEGDQGEKEKKKSTVGETQFKIPGTFAFADSKDNDDKSKTSNPVSSNIFGTSNTNSMFSGSNTSTPFKIQPVTNTTPKPNLSGTTEAVANTNTPEKKSEGNKDVKKLTYYSKLKGLNESVSDWIKKHVEETPLCILSPIFKDYEKYLKEIQEEYQSDNDNTESSSEKSGSEVKNVISNSVTKTTPLLSSNTSGSSLFSSTGSPSSKSSLFGKQDDPAPTEQKPSGFSFGINSTSNNNVATISSTSGGFSFGITPNTTTAINQSPFSLGSNVSANNSDTNTTAPFSFGIGKPFSFSPNVQKSAEESKEDTEGEDEPPKVEFTPVVEENSVYDTRCKIFVKNDGNFADKGVGTLYIKKIEDSEKHQLLVRANTSLGNVLLNLILSSSIPMQRLGKNNVMLVCIPTPEAKPPPTPVLIRVKTSDEADALLETLDKFKA